MPGSARLLPEARRVQGAESRGRRAQRPRTGASAPSGGATRWRGSRREARPSAPCRRRRLSPFDSPAWRVAERPRAACPRWASRGAPGEGGARGARGAGRGPLGTAGAAFADVGCLGPLQVLSKRECRRVLRALETEPPQPADWVKALAVGSRLYYDVATRPEILDVVSELLGGQVILWG